MRIDASGVSRAIRNRGVKARLKSQVGAEGVRVCSGRRVAVRVSCLSPTATADALADIREALTDAGYTYRNGPRYELPNGEGLIYVTGRREKK